MDQGSTKKRSAVHNFVPTVTKFCVMWEGLSLPQDTKLGNCRDEIVDRRVIFIWSLIHGSSWSGLIKVGPGGLAHNGVWLKEGIVPTEYLNVLSSVLHWLSMIPYPLRWRHNGCDSVSNHQPHRCLLNRLFRRRSKKTSKLRVTGLCFGEFTRTGEFPAQRASYAENVSIRWRHHVYGSSQVSSQCQFIAVSNNFWE